MEKMRMRKFDNIYWIGGSPCSGKSSIAELLIKEFGFEYYKCDDFLDDYIKRGSEKNIQIMNKFLKMDLDETWLREVESQVEDEFEFYINAFEFIKEDLSKITTEKPVIVEGAAILPELILLNKIDSNNYICIVPTKEFQREKYSQRMWVKDYLSGCTDPEKAFNNWMDRDINFALKVKNEAITNGFEVIVVDGSKSIEENYEHVKKHFKLLCNDGKN